MFLKVWPYSFNWRQQTNVWHCQDSPLILTSVAGPLAALLLAVVVVSLTTDRFMMERNLSNVSLQVSTVAIAAIGSTLVILTGGIDLSPGAIVALTSCTLAILTKNQHIPVVISIPMTLGLGVVLGFVNGFFSTYGRIPSFVVTLATMSVYRGLAFLITEGHPIFSVSPDLDPVFYGKFLVFPCRSVTWWSCISSCWCSCVSPFQAGRFTPSEETSRRRACRVFRSIGRGCWPLFWPD